MRVEESCWSTAGDLGNPRRRWVSNAGGTSEELAFSSVPRCEPRFSGNRHNNPRRLLSVPRPLGWLQAALGRTGMPDNSFRPLWRQQHQSVRDLRLHNHSRARPNSEKWPGRASARLSFPRRAQCFGCFGWLVGWLRFGEISSETESPANNTPILSPPSDTFSSPLGNCPNNNTQILQDP